MYQKFLNLINEFDIITIYRHVNPDTDALGSQFGLKTWLNENFPDKRIFALGNNSNNSQIYPINDLASDEEVSKSLAIILDVGIGPRVDDQRYVNAKKIIRIDHHPQESPNIDLCILKTNYASTAEIVAELLFDTNYLISKKTASYLYRGILADTAGFKTSSTNKITMQIAAKLASLDIDLYQLSQDVFDQNISQFKLANFLRNNAIINEFGVCYLILSKSMYEPFGLDKNQVKDQIFQFSGISDLNIWSIFVENDEGTYDGSLRSRQIQINDIAEKYNGGGHKVACGVKNLTIEEVHEIIKLFSERVNNEI